MQNKKQVWITWERQTRNRSMAKMLQASYIEYGFRKGLLRYFVLSFKTILFLVKNKPEVIYFQNPSVVLGMVCVLYGVFSKRPKLIGDYHNCALDESSRMFPVNAFIARYCALVIVTNPSLEIVVKRMKAVAVSCPDPLPDLEIKVEKAQQNRSIVFVTSWADDEPINEVLNAYMESGLSDEGISLLITGRAKLNKLAFSQDHYERCGITFLGFVDEACYWMLLQSAYFVVDLTTRENCMVCGAYEALAVRRVLLLSNNTATTEYFGFNVTYTNNTQTDICEKLKFIHQNIALLNDRVNEIFISVTKKQHDNVNKIKSLVEKN